MLLGTLVLGGLLAAPTALAAPVVRAAPAKAVPAVAPAKAVPAVKAAVARVGASPAKRSGGCPTTVGFSAVVTAKGRGTVRYRWVRSDGGAGAVKSLRVNGARKAVVRDRQTYDRTTSGWQAVEILGKKSLSAKARFRVTCAGPAKVWDVANPLPARPGEPLTVAAALDARPPVHSGACPATVTFTATIQVSRTPARVGYQWIDSVTGESLPESMHFAAGGPRSRQVSLPLGVGNSTSGWKAVHILSPNGHDSARAAYAVTCRTTPQSPSPSATPTPTPTPTPTGPPAGKPEPRIVGVTPGDYEGDCTEPLAYQAAGRVTLPAGPARQVTYWWILDGTAWQRQVLDFPAGDRPRSQDVSATWSLGPGAGGDHTIGLMVEGGPAGPAEHRFTVACAAEPERADLTVRYLLTPLFRGDCDGSFSAGTSALVTTDRETEIRYRFVVDGKPGPTRSERLRPGVIQSIGDFWYSSARTSGTGIVRLEVLNHNKPVKEGAYSWTCVPPDPSPGAVRINELTPVAYYGDCVTAPYVTAHGGFAAAPGTQITYRWVIDGEPQTSRTLTVEGSGVVQVQSAYWSRNSKTSGTVGLEVLNHNRPVAQAAYPVTCQS
ncbi:hypothetical protein [Streptosporangium pseudovulgare]|uniref:Ig-like domain-containing protein n=1 Tax=Streptosporangium pseudovulgare TaxID=35765 RepID=A0ABQ2QN87_9ACTN|nr:hypothetical protein [Streptosporangium pseudovulgare]GGP86201.1 hypothetical protein GCM10010140_14560 [Streptosporangium pseudovulgare]